MDSQRSTGGGVWPCVWIRPPFLVAAWPASRLLCMYPKLCRHQSCVCPDCWETPSFEAELKRRSGSRQIGSQAIKRSIDQSIDRSIGRSIERSIDRSIGRSIARNWGERDRSIERSIVSIDRSIDRSSLIDRLVDRALVYYYFASLVRRNPTSRNNFVFTMVYQL